MCLESGREEIATQTCGYPSDWESVLAGPQGRLVRAGDGDEREEKRTENINGAVIQKDEEGMDPDQSQLQSSQQRVDLVPRPTPA